MHISTALPCVYSSPLIENHLQAAKPACPFTGDTHMHARYLNSIAAIIVPGNCPVERVSLCKGACSCAKRGLIIRNLTEIPIGSCVFHSISSLTAGSEHGTNYTKKPPQLITRQHWHGNRDATSPGNLVHSFHYIKKKKEKEKKKEASELIPILKTLEYFFIKLFQMTEINLS